MPQNINRLFLTLCILIFSKIACAAPWFTGPIFAAAGHTVPRGHTNFEVYALGTFTNGQYNSSGQIIHTPLFKSIVLEPILTHGFTDWMDIQLAVPYAFNSTLGANHDHIADSSVAVGLQLIEQKKHKLLPDFRLLIQEVFPIGSYEQLNPELMGTDSTGLGSYETNVALNFQYLAEVFDSHYLRTRLILSRVYYSPVNIIGISSFGGTPSTKGTVHPGTQNDIDLAFEFTVTQNWVAVMEGYITRGQANVFNGTLDPAHRDTTLQFRGPFTEKGLAPAIEYNFNANVGIIGGVWFPVKGSNTSHFISYVVALNAYW